MINTISRGRRRLALLAGGSAVVLTVTMLGGYAWAEPSPTPSDSTESASPQPLKSVPQSNLDRGMSYEGLKAAQTGPCVGLFEVVGVTPTMCTHGPDEAPSGLDVKTSVKALPATMSTESAAPNTLAACEGDGVSGKRVEVLYIHGSTSRYDEYLETFRTVAENVDVIFNQSAAETGGARRVRYVTETVDGVCRPVVRDVQIADSALNSSDWAPVLNAVKAAGYDSTDRKYLEFVDTDVFCGLGGFAGDTRKSDDNRSNFGPEYARADNGCWSAGVAAHELGHTLGAVNNNAPNASGAAHCLDEWDVMCYEDSDSVTVTIACSDRSRDINASTGGRLDCNHDDYYHTDPPAGSYLATNFNVADNLFLIKEPVSETSTAPTPESSGN